MGVLVKGREARLKIHVYPLTVTSYLQFMIINSVVIISVKQFKGLSDLLLLLFS